MPKELHEIKKFITGTITTPSEADIADDASVYAKNIDPVAKDGIIVGIPTDTTVADNGIGGNGTALEVVAAEMAMINDDGTRRAVYFDSTDSMIKKIDDLHGTTPTQGDVSEGAESASVIPVMQPNNKEVHIGLGKEGANEPKWCGIIKEPQFDNDEITDLQLLESKLISPSAFPDFYKVVNDGTFIYGIKWKGHYLYQMKISDNSLVQRSTTDIFIKAQGLCLDKDGIPYVYDAGVGDYGTLFQIETLALGKSQSNLLSAGPEDYYPEEGYNISDVIIVGDTATTADNIWFSATGEFGPGGFAYCLFQGPLPVGNGELTLTARPLWCGWSESNQTKQGNFVRKKFIREQENVEVNWGNGVTYEDQGEEVMVGVPKCPLFVTDKDETGWEDYVGIIVHYYREKNEYGSRALMSHHKDNGQGENRWETTDVQIDKLVCEGTVFSQPVNGGGALFDTPTDSWDNLLPISNNSYINSNVGLTGGVWVYNVNTGARAQVEEVLSDTILQLTDDIFETQGDNFEIEREVTFAHHKWDAAGVDYWEMTPVSWAVVIIRDTSTHSELYNLGDKRRLFTLGDNIVPPAEGDGRFYHGGSTDDEPFHANEDKAHEYMYGVQCDHVNGKMVISGQDTSQHDGSNFMRWEIPKHNEDQNVVTLKNYVERENRLETDVKESPHTLLDAGSDIMHCHIFAGGDGSGAWLLAENNDETEPDATWDEIETLTETILNIIPSTTDQAESENFEDGYKYFWKASFLYDGYQESPLSDDYTDVNDGGKLYHITVQLRTPDHINNRVSHLKIYRASSTTDSEYPEGFYRLVTQVPLNFLWKKLTNDDGETYFEYTFQDIGSGLESYEAATGISEVVFNTYVNYSLSAQLNNVHFVGNASHVSLGQGIDSYLFKSKPYNFDQFDWTRDILRLPTKPVALAGFSGRLYAFDENNTYRIEPNSFFIEDTYEGIGCLGPDAVVVTELGMCFADNNNIYMHDGRKPVPIGNSILRGNDDYSWQNRDKAWLSKVIFDAKRGSYVVLFKKASASNYYAWSYNIARNRWDLWDIFGGSTEPLGTLAGKDGEMLICDGTNLVNYQGHASSKQNWDWTSKKLTMGTDTQLKSFKKTRISGNTGGGLDTFLTSEGTPSTSGATDGLSDYVYNLSGAESKAKWIQYTFAAEPGTVDAIGTIFRRGPVK